MKSLFLLLLVAPVFGLDVSQPGISPQTFNLNGGAANQVPYQSNANTTVFDAGFTYSTTSNDILKIGGSNSQAGIVEITNSNGSALGKIRNVANGDLCIDSNSANALVCTQNATVGINTPNPLNQIDLRSAAVSPATYVVVVSSQDASTIMLGVDAGGHVRTGTSLAPGTSSCNSRAVNAGSNDNRGSVTFSGGAQTACTINFNTTGGSATPFCTCANDSGITAVQCAPGSGTLTMTLAVAANSTLSYHCDW